MAPLGASSLPRRDWRQSGRHDGGAGGSKCAERPIVRAANSCRDGKIEEATADTVLHEGDIVAVAGPARRVGGHSWTSRTGGRGSGNCWNVPAEGVDVYVTNKAVDGKTLAELAELSSSRGVFLRRIVRGATATIIPILPTTTVQRGDIFNGRSSGGSRTPPRRRRCWVMPTGRRMSPMSRLSAARSPWAR